MEASSFTGTSIYGGTLFVVLQMFLLAVLALAVFGGLRFGYLPFQVLKRCGIPGPTPSFFYGNYKEMTEVGTLKYFKEQHERYGDIVGTYMGSRPFVSTTDIELVRLITVKDSDVFINRPHVPSISGRKHKGLFFERNDDWRTARRTLTPTFSTFKLKAMTPLIEGSVKTLVEVVQKHANSDVESVEIVKIFGSFTMETILATAFGRMIDVQRGESSQLTQAAANIFAGVREGQNASGHYVTTLYSNIPCFQQILKYAMKNSKQMKMFSLFYDTAVQLIQQRRAGTEVGKHKDLLQLMIDTTVDEEGSTDSKKKLTDEQIAMHSIIFMLAGYETTGNTLSYTAYLLALNPHIQENLQEEIDRYFKEHPDVSAYEAAQALEYVDMVVHEALRLYPPASSFERECARDYSYKGFTIPKGAAIQIAAYLIHKRPEYWEDPEKFDPLRFSADKKAQRPQHCFMPFGSGPRTCIGMRFALLEAKIALIELFKRFSVIKAPDTEIPLKLVLGATMSPKDGIRLKIVNRK